jgi:alpha-1,6-mannosyltransferase
VVSVSSALREIVRPDCGAAVDDHAGAFAGAVEDLLAAPEPGRRAAARARAEEFSWSSSKAVQLAGCPDCQGG